MALVDTSVWVEVLRDANHRPVLEDALGGQDVVLTRFTQLELLQGSRDEREWQLLAEHLEAQNYLEFTPATWAAAARIYFDLRRDGKAVRSPIDCCMAQLAIEHDVELLHCDRDFEVIATARNLRQRRINF
ncbi:MAG: twitching motility protein PilT [Gemmatimonadetes bacterium RIFCSPLOWO2_12_FULL_68_9]|nr:MAG: twitching motility protein PilT [Gemmatimonadetes bacterium RIFCSPLOWO2_12_FULL_68_9]